MRRIPWSLAIISVCTIAALAAFAFLPIGVVLSRALEGRGALLAGELADAGTREAWLNTLILALLVTSIAVPTGAILAWIIERTDAFTGDRARARATALFALPLAVPPYLLAMAWALLGNGRNGVLNRLGSSPWIDLYGMDGTVLVLACGAYPFSLLATRAALVRADPSLEEAARVSGASPLQVLSSVTLPLVTPALAASAGLVFVFATAAFGVPYLMGSVADPPVHFLTTRIFRFTTLGGADMLSRAASVALILLFTSIVAQMGFGKIAARRSAVQVSGKAARPSLVRLGRGRTVAHALLAFFAVLVIVTPLATIAWTSLLRTFADPTSLSLTHWIASLGRAETARAFLHSIVLAGLAGAIVAMLGLAVARLASRLGRAGEWLSALASAPYAVPGTVLAIGLILTFSHEIRVIVLDRATFALYLPGTLGILLVAYAVKYLSFGVRGARAALAQLDPSLEEAARTSGAGPLRGTIDVVLPLVSPSVGAAFFLVALPCLSELTMSVLLFGAGTETAGTLLFELQSYANPSAACVIATMVVMVAVLGDITARRLARFASERSSA